MTEGEIKKKKKEMGKNGEGTKREGEIVCKRGISVTFCLANPHLTKK